ncbi:MAG TPA: TIGR03084 family metal-binding protein [Nocardioides sp.]|uniref:TIGR03084 family metal-binding protein n=1 Tax=Nocardioides sp. TaxID=35761 RepID=UPI002F402F32
MSAILDAVLDDLATESARLEALVVDLPEEGWRTPTPAPGWDVATQIAHLAWTDEAAYAAATDKERWDDLVLEALADPEHAVDRAALTGSIAAPAVLLERWHRARSRLAEALRNYPAEQRMPWYGPPMSPASMATARFMETWAHSLDVHAALGVEPEVTDRIRHVAHLGVRTRDWAFSVRGLEPPAEEFRIDLTAPSGDVWAWGPEAAPQTVTGTAYDFCLLVTQRIHRADTSLVATGRDADRWLDVAQAFAGPPGEGREPRDA